jgi:predicted phosphodiesterase
LFAGVLRILSDLHVYDVRSQVRDLRQLEPLLAGVHTLVINGDSCEMRPGVALPDVTRLRNFFRERVSEVIFVTGNHDPDISDTHELLLADARVWVTHGDVFFDDLTPWSRTQSDLIRAVNGLLAAEPADYSEVTTRLRIAREAARIVGVELDPADGRLWAQLVRLCDTFFPPRQILAMLRSWRDLPALAAKLAVAQRPSAQVVVTGHVHFPGVWMRPPGPTVINTGSFFSPLGGHLVDISADQLQVRRIRSSRGQFEPGRLITVIQLNAVVGT